MFNLSFNGLHVLLLSLLIAYLHSPAQSDNALAAQLQVGPHASSGFAGNILLLTAHPDDECMFFAPTILALAALQGPSVSSRDPTSTSSLYSLCMSVGNADGLGAIRKYELGSSLDLLGVDTDKRLVVDHPYVLWRVVLLAEYLMLCVGICRTILPRTGTRRRLRACSSRMSWKTV
jgi:N-acetylglucosaminylphosphatidylinositol deacetylase